MFRRLFTTIAVALALSIPAVSWAHGGHTHKVMGTVTAVTDKQIEVKTTDGKTVALAVDAKTAYRQGKVKVDAKAVKVGERIVVDAEGADAAKTMTARTVTVPASAPAAAAIAK